MTWNRSGVSATRMRAQITLFGVTIAFVPADQDCRAERRFGGVWLAMGGGCRWPVEVPVDIGERSGPPGRLGFRQAVRLADRRGQLASEQGRDHSG
jgi:hypothetical protein